MSQGGLNVEDIMAAINDLKMQHIDSTKEFNKSYELLHLKVEDSLNINKVLTEKLNKFMDKIDKLKSENRSLKAKIDLLENKLEEQEQYTRKNCVEIQGVPIRNSVLETVQEVGSALGMPIREDMIDACHSLRKRTNSDGPSGIIVKFVRRIDAENFLAKRRDKRDLSTRHLNMSMDNPIYLNESLTPKRRLLLKEAREFKKTNNYKRLWVQGGKIYLKREDDGPVINVKCQSDLKIGFQLFIRAWLSQCYQNLRPWSVFFNTSHFKTPLGIQQLTKRLMKNYVYFLSNYLVIVFILTLYCLITTPLLLLAVCASLGVCYSLSRRNAQRPLVLMGRTLTMEQQYALVAGCSIPIFVLVGAGSAMFWALGTSFYVITLHAAFFNIAAISTDQDD